MLILPILISLIVAMFFIPVWIKKASQMGLIWADMNKYKHPKKVVGSGGVIVVMAFMFGVLVYIALNTFLFKDTTNLINIFALLLTIIIAGFIGFVDDIAGWAKGGLSMRLRILLTFIAAIPLAVINAGTSTMDLPVLGLTNIGIFYSLILIPLGIVGATTTYNFLAGFNGLEAGQGIIIISFLSYISYLTGSSWLALIGLCMVLSLVVFYSYNRFPAKIFPGDIMTYSIGALIACMAILGNFEKIAVFIFIPYILEVILKVRGKIDLGPFPWSFGIPNKDGSLNEPYDKIYGLEHLAIRILKKIKSKVYEKDVSYLIFSFQIILCLASLFIFKNSLF